MSNTRDYISELFFDSLGIITPSEKLVNIHKEISDLKLYQGTQITRWSSRNYIKSENDCEHQNIVSQITIYLCEKFNVSIETYRNAVCLASIHDMFEYADGGMGDVPHSVKAKSPEIKKIVEEHEREVITQIPNIGKAWEIFSKDELANIIVEFADQLDVLLYIDREFSLGNDDEDFKEIYEKAYHRVDKIYERLENALQA